MKSKIIIDTDPGVDDAIALMMAFNSDMFTILAVTTVCGNSTVKNSMRNAKYILNSIGASEIPLFQGSNSPLVRPLQQAVVHGDDGLLGMNTLGQVTSDGDAVDAIIDEVTKYPNEVTIIAIGPLTNIARAIQRSPSVMLRVQKIVIMGGTINETGNMPNGAEFNFFIDPEAAKIVCEFPVPKFLIPLDVCNKAVINLVDFNNEKEDKNTTLLRRLIEPYAKNIYSDTGINGAIMYDPLAVYYAMNQNVFTLEEVFISIGIGNDDRGVMTKEDIETTSISVMAATGFVAGFVFADVFMEAIGGLRLDSR